jgi:hypothetical protein
MRFVEQYAGGRMVAVSGVVEVGAVYPPVKNGDPWVWRLWFGYNHMPKQGARPTCLGAKNALRAQFLDLLKSANLEEHP